MNQDIILELYKNTDTVFSLKEISLLFPDLSYKALINKLSYAVKTGKLKKVRKGIYVKDNFDRLELANKLYTPSYISLETVLAKNGIIFQEYRNTIFAISYLTRRIKLASGEIFYRKIKDKILLNGQGVERAGGCSVASKERAFLDAVFLYKNYHFDNLKPLDWDKVKAVKNIYQSQTLEKRVEEYFKIYKHEYV